MTKDPSPQAVLPGRGLAWIADGWSLFMRQPGTWIGMTVIAGLIYVGCGVIPVIGQLLTPFVQTLLGAGILLAARRLQSDGRMELGDLFGALSHPARDQLLVLAGIYLLMLLGSVALLFILGFGGAMAALFGGLFSGGEAAVGAVAGTALVAVVVVLTVLTVILAMYWFAVPLVALGGVKAWDAMLRSLTGVLANLLPLLVWGIVATVLMIVASIPLLLGLLVVMPLLAASVLISYQDIFEGD